MQQCYFTGFEDDSVIAFDNGKKVTHLIQHSPDLAIYAWNTNHKRKSGTRRDVLCGKCARSIGAWKIKEIEHVESDSAPIIRQ